MKTINFRLIICALLILLANIHAFSSDDEKAKTSSPSIISKFDKPFTYKDSNNKENQTLMDAYKDYLDSHAPGASPEAEAEVLNRMKSVQERFDREHPMPSTSEMVVNSFTFFLSYLFFPFIIRFVFLRRPVKTKWAAILILMIIFIAGTINLNRQRDQAYYEFCEEVGMPYEPRPHMIGSPLLYVAMIFSYYILRKKKKNNPISANVSSPATAVCDINLVVVGEGYPAEQSVRKEESFTETWRRIVDDNIGRGVIFVTNKWRRIFAGKPHRVAAIAVWSFFTAFVNAWRRIVSGKPHRVVAICLGVFLITVSCFPVLMISYRSLWWRIDSLMTIGCVFVCPFIGTIVAVVMVFIAFLKE